MKVSDQEAREDFVPDARAWLHMGMTCASVRNFGRAAKCFRGAAEQGYADAQNNLGVAYLEGRGVGKNRKRAAYWFRKAAEQGDEMALDQLRKMADPCQ